MPALLQIEGPKQVMRGGAAHFKIKGAIQGELARRIRWRIGANAVGRGSSLVTTVAAEVGAARVTANLPGQAPVVLDIQVAPEVWPAIGHDWVFQAETIREGKSTALGSFRGPNGVTTPRFIVGTEVSYLGNRGLGQANELPFYRATDYALVSEIGHWAHVIEPTAKVEGDASFVALNTYDNASFTFGFIQFSAKNYDANFHELMRNLFEDPTADAAGHLPFFRIENREIYSTKAPSTRLTSPDRPDNALLRRYIKPDPKRVSAMETELGARMIYWTRAVPALRTHQVKLATKDLRKKIKPLLPLLDGKTDRAFCWLVDMYVHGAPPRKQVEAAIRDPNPEQALCDLKAVKHPERAGKLKVWIDKKTELTCVYDKGSDQFIPGGAA